MKITHDHYDVHMKFQGQHLWFFCLLYTTNWCFILAIKSKNIYVIWYQWILWKIIMDFLTLSFIVAKFVLMKTWKLFLKHLVKEISFELYNMTIISIMEKCLDEVIKIFFSNLDYQSYLFHLWNNLNFLLEW